MKTPLVRPVARERAKQIAKLEKYRAVDNRNDELLQAHIQRLYGQIAELHDLNVASFEYDYRQYGASALAGEPIELARRSISEAIAHLEKSLGMVQTSAISWLKAINELKG